MTRKDEGTRRRGGPIPGPGPARSTNPAVAVLWVLAVALTSCRGGGGPSTTDPGLTAPPEWTPVGRSTVREPLCSGPDCVTVVVRWVTAEPPGRGTVESLLRSAGYRHVVVEECAPRPGRTGPIPFCSATATTDGGAPVRLRVSGPSPADPEHPYTVVLTVSPG